jgi:crotonobetainyl-CoA:carnitine CoA-transferase CaiB-like acyl-CoA transferase
MPSQDPEQTFDGLIAEAARFRMERDNYSSRLAEVTAERDRLKDQIAQLVAARHTDAAHISEVCAQLDTAHANLAAITRERDALAAQVLDRGTGWVEVNRPFSALCERMIDPTRLVGLEIEVNGERYIIGDVNPGGHREGGQAFRRDAVVTRARVRVRK